MDDSEIKQEFCSIDNLCGVCMSAGRHLLPLGDYENIFKTILSDFEYKDQFSLDNIQLCWECIAVLRKVGKFQEMVLKAHKIYYSGQFIHGPLSNLTTIILNDAHTHTLYMYENTHKSVPDANFHCDDNDCDGDDNCDDLKSEELVQVPVEPKKANPNRWATKRALQNKKPKFKITTDYTKEDFKNFWTKREMITPYICDVCNSYMANKRHLADHISEHYYKYTCTLCDFTCYSQSQKGWHYRLKHKKIFQCVKCGLKFGNRKVFYKHYKEWHEKFICDLCGVSFKMKYCIKEHIRKQHSPYECKPCNRRFARYNGLWLHNKLNHNENNSSMYCVECDRRYPDVYRYKWHLANSAKHNRRSKRRVPCPGCEKVFSKNIYMKDHYNLVHLKFYKYRCEQCDKNFIRNADLVKHNKRIHEGIFPPKNKICYICGRGFTTNKMLLNHIARHTASQRLAK